MYFYQHSAFILFFATFPFMGWVIQEGFPQKPLSYIGYASLILLLPALTGYSYTIENGYGILLYIAATSGYAWIIRKMQHKFWSTVAISALIFCIAGFCSFMGGMAGKKTIERAYTAKGYKLEYVVDQGFAGQPLITWQLSKYAIIPLFIKPVETKADDSTTQGCWIKFTTEDLNFNKCEPDSSYIAK